MRATCTLCPHRCSLEEGRTGWCRARMNVNGAIICENYGRITSIALDPIEKKPFARFHPGTMILSAGSYGCNMRCPFCQNHEISMSNGGVRMMQTDPAQLVRKALELRQSGNIGLAMTYNEPLVSYEFVRDCFRLAKREGLATALVTNGCVSREPLEELLPLVDAMNIDLKCFRRDLYREWGGDLPTVQQSISLAARRCHLEVTTLVIPGVNDNETEFDDELVWLANVSTEIPLHLTRFFPKYQMTNRQPTPVATLTRLRELAKKRLKYVYLGNC